MGSAILQLIMLVGTGAAAYWLARRRAAAKVEFLQKAVDRKEHENQCLLREIDQRLKDNMQIVISLTNLESRRAKKGVSTADRALRQLQGRFNAMAIIQRALSHRTSATTIAAKPMVLELVNQQIRNAGFSIDADIETNNVELDVLLAGPLGLIVHEICGQVVRANGGTLPAMISIELTEAKEGQNFGLRASFEQSVKAGAAEDESLSDDIVEMMCEQLRGKMERFEEPAHMAWALQYSRAKPNIALH